MSQDTGGAHRQLETCLLCRKPTLWGQKRKHVFLGEDGVRTCTPEAQAAASPRGCSVTAADSQR